MLSIHIGVQQGRRIKIVKIDGKGSRRMMGVHVCRERLPEDLSEDTMMVALILSLSFDLDVQSDSVLSWSCAFGKGFRCISKKGR